MGISFSIRLAAGIAAVAVAAAAPATAGPAAKSAATRLGLSPIENSH